MPPRKPIQPAGSGNRPIRPVVKKKKPVLSNPDAAAPSRGPARNPVPGGETSRNPAGPIQPSGGTSRPPEPQGGGGPAGGAAGRIPVERPVERDPAPDDRPAPAKPAVTGKISRSVFQSLKDSNAENLKSTNEILSAELKKESARVLTDLGFAEFGKIAASAGDVDFSRSKDMPVREWIKESIAAKIQPQSEAAVELEEAVSRLPEKLTLGAVMGLDIPLKEHPLFRFSAAKGRLSSLVETAPVITPAAGRVFSDLVETHQGSAAEFWEALAKKPEFKKAGAVEDAARALRLDLLTGQNLELVRALETKRKKGEWETLRDLTALDEAEWIKAVKSAGFEDESLLDAFEGETKADKIAAYARHITGSLKAAFPAEALRLGLEAEKDAAAPIEPKLRSSIAKVLAKAEDLDLASERLDDYFSRRPETLSGIDKPEDVKREMKRVQRVFRVVPDYAKMKPLLSSGVDSAQAIASIPWPSFKDRFSEALGGETEARAYYMKAAKMNAYAVNLYAEITHTMKDVLPQAVGGGSKPSLKDIPHYENLFGTLDLCECKHCSSVYSPAAYLVDLLQFLRQSSAGRASLVSGSARMKKKPELTAQIQQTALTVLAKRRPDLEHLKLTCENTNTVMPYVDLVNEILESYAVLGRPDKDAANDTGGAPAEELSVNPQFTNEKAYELLAQAVHPAPLPFDKPLETARAYFEHLGTSRREIMETFANKAGASAAPIAAEALGIGDAERKILTGKGNTPLQRFYGYGNTTVDRKAWHEDLARVPEFLKRTGISYEELIELLKTRFINENKKTFLDSPASEISLEKTKIENLLPKLPKIHVFLRLRKKLGWTIPELDKALHALKAEEITDGVLEKLALAVKLQAELRVKLLPLLSFWSPIDTYGEEPLYAKLFLNRAVLNPVDPAFALKENGEELQKTNLPLSAQAAALLAALNLNAQDLQALFEACGFADGGSPAKLNLRNLSELYRHAVFAKALRIPVRDFLVLKALTGIDPFASPAQSAAFAEKARKVKLSGFKPAQLVYVYRHVWDLERPAAPPDELIEHFIGQIRSGLVKIAAETAVPEDTTGEILAVKLAAVLEPPFAAEAMLILDGASELAKAGKEAFIAEHFDAFLDAEDAKAVLLAASSKPAEEQKRDRIRYVLENLMTHLRREQSNSFIIQSLAERFGLETEITKVFVTEILDAPALTGKKLIDEFLKLGEGDDSAMLPKGAFLLMHKVSLLAGGFKLTASEALYFHEHGADFGGFDWNALPLQEGPGSPDDFRRWERLFDFASMRSRLPQPEAELIEVFEASGLEASLEKLRLASAWNAEDLAFASGPSGFAFSAADFKNETALLRLDAAFRLSEKTGMPVKLLFQWAAETPDEKQAGEIVKGVRAKYDEASWLEAGKPLNDRLRDLRKEALIAYVLPRVPGIGSADQLFEYFLIDVDMCSCMDTSRIKQAISSVQTFIQRCLMNLEPEVEPYMIDDSRWEWMKNYRVWEANRKVFLYPENWAEPEWRDDKTPFFKELESELLQNELSPENVEKALFSYLEKLDEVSRLSVVSIHRPMVDCDGNTVHVFARTSNPPHAYYYRNFQIAPGLWSPWEKIGLDIEGEHLIPVLFNRRLYLFWPLFEEKSMPQKGGADAPSRSYYEIKLCWSEYRQGKWMPKKTAREVLNSYPVNKADTVPPPIDRHVFTANVIPTNTSGFAIALEMHNDPKPDANSPNYETTRYWGQYWFEDRVGEAVVTNLDEGSVHSTSFLMPEDTLIDGMALKGSAPFKMPESYQSQKTVLEKGSGQFRMIYPHERFQDLGAEWYPFVFEDKKRAYFVHPKLDGPKPKKEIMPGLLNGSVSMMPRIGGGTQARKLPVEDSAEAAVFRRSSLMTLDGGSKAMISKKAAAPAAKPSAFSAFTAASGVSAKTKVTDGTFSLGSGVMEIMPGAAAVIPKTLYLHFEAFFHPHTDAFMRAYYQKGVEGLLSLATQQLENKTEGKNIFESVYQPTGLVHWDRPAETVDFTPGSPYSIYNWELFFHVPLLIAVSLARDGRHDDAFEWFHRVFNPASSSSDPAPRRYWNFLPFYRNGVPQKEQIQELLEALSSKGTQNQALAKKREAVLKQTAEWRRNPFNPHAIARMRITAYQKFTVMKYIDALISKADQLFTMDTIETINEATQLYILAANMLGPRPEKIPPKGAPEAKTFAELKTSLDGFSNALVAIENEFPFEEGEDEEDDAPKFKRAEDFKFTKAHSLASAGPLLKEMNPMEAKGIGRAGGMKLKERPELGKAGGIKDAVVPALSLGYSFYFCVPKNEKLLSYWDTVADRLFKIRNCMNIEGVVRELPLFEPPIDPAMLIRAKAMGLELSSVLQDLRAPLPRHRFSYLAQKAFELAGEVKSLGGALLSALEKKDTEQLGEIRARHEINLLKAAREVRKKQIEESRESYASLVKQREVTEIRYQYYRNISYRNSQEDKQMQELSAANGFEEMAQGAETTGNHLANIPDFTTGSGGMGPVATSTFGGSNLAEASRAMGSAFSFFAGIHSRQANKASILGGWTRRWEEWKLQERLAARELQQLDKQILASEVRLSIAEKELENHEKQIEQAEEVESFLKNKFTSRELYGWMVTRISTVYYQTYKLAYDLAKKAERAWQLEYGPNASSFIKFGYWDSLKKGLLSGEELWLDLKRMEAAALETPREYEITKNISLLQLAPDALIALKRTGKCEFIVPEELFAMDYPGHYNRRIKAVTLTVPCVTGPYTSVNASLTLLENRIRVSPSAAGGYAELEDEEDARFVRNYGPVQTIVTSSAQNDGGLFEMNFRDERYLPFEGAGVDSRWRLELKKESNAFDLETVPDVILKMQYRAREGGELLAKAAREAVIVPPQEDLARLFSVRHEFPGEWHRFLNPPETAASQKLELPLAAERFPFQLRGKDLEFQKVELYLKLKEGVQYPGGGQPLKLSVTAEDGAPVKGALESAQAVLAGMPRGIFDVSAEGKGAGTWVIEVKETDVKTVSPELRKQTSGTPKLMRLKAEMIADLLVLVRYNAS